LHRLFANCIAELHCSGSGRSLAQEVLARIAQELLARIAQELLARIAQELLARSLNRVCSINQVKLVGSSLQDSC